MNYIESVNAGLAAFHRATEAMLSSRTILVLSVLQMKPRAEVAKALAEVEPEGRKPSDSTVGREIARTTRQMGLPELPTEEKGGRPSFETRDNYKREHCAKWIAANGGMPRVEQLADPNWDLKPYPPAISSARPALMVETATAATAPGQALSEASGINPAIPATPAPRSSPPSTSRENPKGDTSVENAEAMPSRSVEEIQEQIRNFPVVDKKAWEEGVFLLRCELFTVTNPHPPDKGDMNDLRVGLPGMWRDARKRGKKEN